MGKLGDTLRERRMALGLTVEQVQEGTRIRAKLIDAIEEGQYDRLPNPGYVRGYISSYARFLELDPVPLLNMYKAETGAGRQHNINLPQAEEAVKPTGQQHAVPRRAAVTIALAVGIIALIIWGITSIVRRNNTEVPPVPTPATSETTTPTAGSEHASGSVSAQNPDTQPKTETTTTKKPAAENQPFTVTVKVDADSASWVRMSIDGKVAYEGVLAGGQSKEFEAAKSATVRLGKPESVTVLKDGKQVEIKDTGNLGTVTLKSTTAE